MPTKGQLLESPIIGAAYEFIDTAADTGGKRVALKATLSKKGKIVPDHLHGLQDEIFEVISGQMTIWLNGETKILSAGEKMMLPKNVPHNHYNNHDAPVTYIHSVTPALDFDYFMETFTGLANDGKYKNANFHPLQGIAMLQYLDSKVYLTNAPVGFQKSVAALVAPLARMLGYRAVYKKYSGVEK